MFLMDSRSLVILGTSIRDRTGTVNKMDLAYLRENFVPQRINAIGWLPGYHKMADPMTKDNRATAALLLRTLSEFIFPPHPDTFLHHAESPLPSNQSNKDDRSGPTSSANSCDDSVDSIDCKYKTSQEEPIQATDGSDGKIVSDGKGVCRTADWNRFSFAT